MLKAILTEAEHKSLDETLSGLYKATKDGNFVLDIDVREHPDTLGLKNALVAEREEKETYAKTLKRFDGIDPEKVESLKREKELAQREKDIQAGNIDKLISDATLETNKKLEKALLERDEYKGRVRHLAVNEAALRAINEAGGNSKLLLPHILTVADLDDKGKTIIKGEDGKPLMANKWRSADDFKTISEYVNDLKADSDWAVAFKANGAKGSSAQPSTTTTHPRTPTYTELPGGTRVIQ